MTISSAEIFDDKDDDNGDTRIITYFLFVFYMSLSAASTPFSNPYNPLLEFVKFTLCNCFHFIFEHCLSLLSLFCSTKGMKWKMKLCKSGIKFFVGRL